MSNTSMMMNTIDYSLKIWTRLLHWSVFGLCIQPTIFNLTRIHYPPWVVVMWWRSHMMESTPSGMHEFYARFKFLFIILVGTQRTGQSTRWTCFGCSGSVSSQTIIGASGMHDFQKLGSSQTPMRTWHLDFSTRLQWFEHATSSQCSLGDTQQLWWHLVPCLDDYLKR